ncbi:MAG TPA: tetratricopeptide repeat protein [Rectinemataceae bacterium]|nr:tetratricopeptide repeat protein [Rectinemataceae bacterium]
MPHLFQFLRRLFRSEEGPEPGSLVEELWTVELAEALPASRQQQAAGHRRFLETSEESHRAAYDEEGLLLELKRPRLFAWTEAPLYRHADFVLRGELVFDRDAPYAAAGFLFRYQDESNFYAALVSNRGHLRLDAVFNGSPRSVLAWTELPPLPGGASMALAAAPPEAPPAVPAETPPVAPPEAPPEAPATIPAPPAEPLTLSLTVIARGSHFTLLVNDGWVAEAVDETFRSGHIAFAAQRFEGEGQARFHLRNCFVDSRPVEVETWYYRWNFYVEPEHLARYRLAQTYFAMGEYLAAAVQLRKNERRGRLSADESFLKAEVALRLELYDEAESALDACLEAAPGRQDALDEKANLLYLQSRFAELRSLLDRLLPALPDNARLADLSGHSRFALGDYVGAAEEYRRAAEIEPEQALYRMNEARAWDQAHRRGEAADAYLAAARLFFRQEAEDDLALALHRLTALRPRSPEVKELRAKMLFRQGKRREAATLLNALVAAKSPDSAVYYLLGIIKSEAGAKDEALALYSRAAELEPDYPLYQFRKAETEFALGLDCGTSLARALSLSPEDGWTLNLAGQVARARGDLAEARLRLEAARAALPLAPEPAVNLAELESQEGQVDRALAILEAFPEAAACRNEAGNVLAAAALRASRADEAEALIERAVKEYERACRIDPGQSAYHSNLAAACMRLERYTEAEDHIRAALDLGGEARAYLLAGDLGAVYGDSVRAEAAYRLGLEIAPGDPSLLLALGRRYLASRALAKVKEIQEQLSRSAPEQARSLDAEVEAATMESLTCASCNRLWKVPRDLPSQSGTSIRAMPPDDSPAGACPRCGKIYCISCRKGELVESRFTCPDCGETLKLSDNRLRYLVREHLKRARLGSTGQG